MLFLFGVHQASCNGAATWSLTDNVQDAEERFLQNCHAAVDKDTLFLADFAALFSDICEASFGSNCAKSLSFQSLPRHIHQMFLREKCPHENRIECQHSLATKGDRYIFKGNIDELCASAYPHVKPRKLVSDCRTSRYYKIDRGRQNAYFKKECDKQNSLNIAASDEDNEINWTQSEFEAGSSTDSEETLKEAAAKVLVPHDSLTKRDKGHSKGSKGGIGSDAPLTISPQPPASWTSSPIDVPSPLPIAKPALDLTSNPISSTGTLPPTCGNPPIQSPPILNTLAPTVLGKTRQPGGTSPPVQNTRKSRLEAHHLAIAVSLAGVLFLAVIYASKKARKGNSSKVERSIKHHLSLDGDPSISSERSSTLRFYDSESHKDQESVSKQYKMADCESNCASSKTIHDERTFGSIRTGRRRILDMVCMKRKTRSTTRLFQFPPLSPYLVEEGETCHIPEELSLNASHTNVLCLATSIDLTTNDTSDNKGQFTPRSTTDSHHPNNSVALDDNEKKLDSNFIEVGNKANHDIHQPNIQQTTLLESALPAQISYILQRDIDVCDRNPMAKRDRPCTVSLDIDQDEELWDEEALCELSFLSPDILRQFREVDQRLSRGFKEFDAVEERISEEFEKVASSLGKAASEVVDNRDSDRSSSSVSSDRTTSDDILSIQEKILSQDMLDSSSSCPSDDGNSLSDRQTCQLVDSKSLGIASREVDMPIGVDENVAQRDVVIDSHASGIIDDEKYEFNKLREHFAQSWYKKADQKESSGD